MAGKLDILLLEGQPRPRCHADLLQHEIDPGDGLRHRMLHLNAGIHFDEVKFAVFVEELDRSGAAIFNRLHRLGYRLADPRARSSIDGRRGRLLKDLLMPPLQRTIAFAQMHCIALPVAEHLNFDVPRLGQILLDVDAVVAERGFRLRTRGRERHRQIVRAGRHLHTAPAAARRRLDQHGKAHALGDLHRLSLGLHRAVRTRHHWNAEPLGCLLGLDLVAHDADVFRRRADECDVMFFKNFGEARVFRQKAVARVYGIRARDLASSKQPWNVEIAVGGCRRADAHAFIRQAHMHRIRVRGRVHGNRGNSQFLARALDAQCDFTPVCDQNFVEHILSGSGPGIRRGQAARGRPVCETQGAVPSLIR